MLVSARTRRRCRRRRSRSTASCSSAAASTTRSGGETKLVVQRRRPSSPTRTRWPPPGDAGRSVAPEPLVLRLDAAPRRRHGDRRAEDAVRELSRRDEVLLEMSTNDGHPAASVRRRLPGLARRPPCAPRSTSCSAPRRSPPDGRRPGPPAPRLQEWPRCSRAAIRSGECRQCRTFCDKLIEPRGCLEMRLPLPLQLRGPAQRAAASWAACSKVFGAEIDLDMFELAEAQRGLRRASR